MKLFNLKPETLKRYLLYILMCIPLLLCAQTQQQQKPVRKVYLEHANTMSFDKAVDQERQVLRGEVLFRQDSIWMSCDSAYFYQGKNSFEAFSHVHVWEGDTLQMWCDSMSYDGEALIGELYNNVIMLHKDTRLETEYMIYYRQEGKAHYPNSGWIANPDNHLVSDDGWYYTGNRLAVFQNDVILRNYDFSKSSERPKYPNPDNTSYRPQMTLYSDTLHYSFLSDDVWILGQSRIVNDTATLYTNLGTVNTKSQQSWLYDRSLAVSRGRSATADTLFYDGLAGYGEAWGNFVAYDTLQNMRISGDYCHYLDSPQVMTITRNALAMEFSTRDTLYLHSDTIRSYTAFRDRKTTYQLNDSVMADTMVIDTVHYLTCHFNVRYYRSDMQGVCDSLNYNHTDSLAKFIGNPVMWNENYQISGDTIFAYMLPGGGLDRALVHDNAFLTQMHDTIHYDQISGKGLICYFDSSQINRMDMNGNVQIIFYPEELDKKTQTKYLIGLNQVIGNYLSIWFKNQKMDHLRVWPQPVGSLTPIHLVTEDILYLEGFRWMSYLRPTSPLDVFRDVRMKAEDQQEVIKIFDDNELNGW